MRPEVIQGDVREVLKTLDDESVQCVVTSPPYWGLRVYGVDDQLGLEATPEEFVKNMVDVFREVKRVLRNDGTLWLNLGDSYAGSNGSRGITENTPSVKKGDKVLLKRIEGRNFTEHKKGGMPIISPDSIGLKHKDLVGIPWRVALALQADGWYLRSDIIWNKPNPMPEPVKDRPTKAHEYIFLLTKSAKYYYDHEAIKEKGEYPAGTRAAKASDARSSMSFVNSRPPEYKIYDGTRNKRSVWKIDKYGDAETEAMYRQGMHRDRGKNLIATRPDLPSQKEFVNFIRSKTNAKELSEKSGIKLSTVEHWFRYDESGFSFPNVEDWMIIKDFVKDEDMDKCLTNVQFHYDSVKETGTRNKRSVWKITTKPYKEAHFATFPEELPETCIKAGTQKGDVVLDIFAGSGTTLRVASKLGRKGIGIELNPEYIKILKKRCKIESMSLEAFV